MKEYGDKLSEGNKNAINSALEKLKDAHKNQDLAAIDTAMKALNTAWQAAATEMYASTGPALKDLERGAPGAGNQNAGGASGTDGNNVSDVEYEEVNDSKEIKVDLP